MKASSGKGPLRILYLGDTSPHSTSMHRAEALRRIGCEVKILNPREAYACMRLPGKIHYLTGYRLVGTMVHHWLGEQTFGLSFDLVWVNGGYAISAENVEWLRQRFGPVVSYMNDDPTGWRDPLNWATYCRAIANYDLCAVVRIQSELEFRQLGAIKVVRVWMSFDEIVHAPLLANQPISAPFHSKVAFIGTWMKDGGRNGRDYLLSKLVEAGIPISIWGDRWQKSPNWPKLKPFWRGGALGGRDYVAAIQGAKISLGFLSKGNRDLHTTRSAEIPFAGGLLCAERTSEHLQMYQDGVEAVFWSSADECIRQCQQLLKDDERRKQIRDAGMARIRHLGFGNEIICRRILAELGHACFRKPAGDNLFRMQSLP